MPVKTEDESPGDPATVEFRPYPIGLQIAGRKVVVIGGGPVAERKILRLLKHGAKVILVSPEATTTLQEFATSGKIQWRQRASEPTDTIDAFLVVVATNDPTANATLHSAARAAGALVLRADSAAEGDLVSPATARLGLATIAVFGHDAGPAFSIWLRDQLTAALPPHTADLARLMAELRPRLQNPPSLADIGDPTHHPFPHPDRTAQLIKIVNSPDLHHKLQTAGYDASLQFALQSLDLPTLPPTPS